MVLVMAKVQSTCQLQWDAQYSLGNVFTAHSYCEVVQANTTAGLHANPGVQHGQLALDRLTVVQLLSQLSAGCSEIAPRLTGNHCCGAVCAAKSFMRVLDDTSRAIFSLTRRKRTLQSSPDTRTSSSHSWREPNTACRASSYRSYEA
jgi:hypothetical protein